MSGTQPKPSPSQGWLTLPVLCWGRLLAAQAEAHGAELHTVELSIAEGTLSSPEAALAAIDAALTPGEPGTFSPIKRCGSGSGPGPGPGPGSGSGSATVS